MADKKLYLQTFYVKFVNPLTEQEEERVFVGRAIFTPEELKQLGDEKDIDFLEAHFTPPEINAYEDPDNEKAQSILTNVIRESIKADEEKQKDGKDHIP